MSTDVIFPTGITNGTIDSADLILFSDVSASNATKDCTVASLPVSTATQTALDAKVDDSQLDTDGNLAANSDSLIATQKATKTYADTKVTANAGIVGATKTKITYDAKGLVTAGADATTADIAASTDKNYVTDAQAVVIGNTSGTNTGNQTITNSSDGTSHTVTLSASGGSVKLVEGSNITLTTTGTGADGVVTIASTASGSGDVVGPASSTDNAIARFDSTTGKLIQNSSATVDDSGNAFVANLTTTGNIELGNASDATISRVSAGVIAVEGVTVPTISSTSTLTNKRITKRVVSTTQSATPTINTDNGDIFTITGLAQAITSFTTNLSGTPVAGDMMMIQITDDGTARALTWGASFSATTVALPTTTVISTLLRVLFQWNGSTWACIASV